jgi:hypothetical protein
MDSCRLFDKEMEKVSSQLQPNKTTIQFLIFYIGRI